MKFEPLPDPPQQPSFKGGDRVRVVADHRLAGLVGVVTSFLGPEIVFITVGGDDPRGTPFHRSELVHDSAIDQLADLARDEADG